VVVAGLIASRQRPQTASGVLFLGLEDETGMLNVVVWPSLYARQRHLIRSRSLVRIRGLLQKQDGAISLVAADVQPFELDEQDFTVPGRDFH
jgi:error-prone DNA polymerase